MQVMAKAFYFIDCGYLAVMNTLSETLCVAILKRYFDSNLICISVSVIGKFHMY